MARFTSGDSMQAGTAYERRGEYWVWGEEPDGQTRWSVGSTPNLDEAIAKVRACRAKCPRVRYVIYHGERRPENRIES